MLRNTMLSHDYHIFRVNSKKKYIKYTNESKDSMAPKINQINTNCLYEPTQLLER